jgi:protein SCO1/2
MVRWKKSRWVAATLLAGLALSCREQTANNPSRWWMASGNRRIFQAKGVIKELKPERQQVIIAHEEIPGYMPAMTMPFDVKDAQELVGLQPGDAISFRMIVTPDNGWIDQIKKTFPAAPALSAEPDSFRRVREVEPLQEGDPMPEYHFTNELGQVVSLSDFKGQALAFTFIFTRCPFPTFCPRMSGNFAETQHQLQNMSNAPVNWHLLTISFDPAYDTPAILQSYAARFKADPKRWNFVTGDLIDVTAITEQFGLLFWKPAPNQPGGISHNLRTVVVDARGQVQKIFTENEWKVDDLVAEIVKAAQISH